MNTAMIIDIGSARTKVSIEADGEIIRFKDETNLSKAIDSQGNIDPQIVNDRLLPFLKEMIDKLKELGGGRVIVIGTHAMRSAKNSFEIKEKIQSVTGNLNIIESWVEGCLFYLWINSLYQLKSFITLDVGGGSVQITTGSDQSNVYSIPTGTFTLEREFQRTSESADQAELSRMNDYVRKMIKDSSIPQLTPQVIVLGSNAMEDFITSALKALSTYSVRKSSRNKDIVMLDELLELYDEIKTRSYQELGDYYPANKMFMYGADKALINLIAVCEHFQANQVLPTNESVSSALLNLMIKSPQTLGKYSIESTTF